MTIAVHVARGSPRYKLQVNTSVVSHTDLLHLIYLSIGHNSHFRCTQIYATHILNTFL